MRHIGLQQIFDFADKSCSIGDGFVMFDSDGLRRLSGMTVVGCRIMGGVVSGRMDIMVNGHPAGLGRDDFMDVLEGTRVQFLDISPDAEVFCIFTTRKFIMDALQGVIPQIQSYILKIMTDPVQHLSPEEMAQLRFQAGLISFSLADVAHIYREQMVTLYLRAFSLELCAILVRRYGGEPDVNSGNIRKRDMLLVGFMDLVWKNYLEQREVSFYAKSLCVTPKHLSRVVKEATGKSPHEIIAGEVLALSMQLLRNDDMLVQQVSDILRFSDQAAFSKFFKKYTGVSPAEYRRSGFTLANFDGD